MPHARTAAGSDRTSAMPSSEPPAILPGAEPWSHHAAPTSDGPCAPACSSCTASPATPPRCVGSPRRWRVPASTSSMPRLPGHGTTLDGHDDDWMGRLGRRGGGRLRPPHGAHRAIVVAGLSMGGSLALWTALQHPEIRRPRRHQPGDAAAAARRAGRPRRDAGGRHRRDAGHRQRHRRPRRPRVGLRGDAAAAAHVVPRRRAGGHRGPLRRAGDAAAAAHVTRGPRRPAGRQRVPRRALRRPGRPPLARAQLPRGHPGLRPRRRSTSAAADFAVKVTGS